MAKISFVLLVVALIVFLHVSEAHRSINSNELVLENNLNKAKGLIEEDLKKKEKNIKKLETNVSILSKSEIMLKDLEEAYKNGKTIEPSRKDIKRLNKEAKQEPEELRYVTIIKCILKDLGLNGGEC
ncbi:hypothetical protein IGI04_011423 [Brassica rapa subsp. trilocularis]|uniref:Uncharacterized protein n=2 Tax=Brassica campestris TaxID=3711 RepID=M4C9Y6_BRACM|nr:uncharacterized protein LOC103858925 [Brassica rapa]KAG5405304.1 hypothetical protein IGI04_011423 [Brassica rapa subsp. trilocularis]